MDIEIKTVQTVHVRSSARVSVWLQYVVPTGIISSITTMSLHQSV